MSSLRKLIRALLIIATLILCAFIVWVILRLPIM